MVARENYERSASVSVRILACKISNYKMGAVTESREIARIAYLGQITNIGSGRVQKL